MRLSIKKLCFNFMMMVKTSLIWAECFLAESLDGIVYNTPSQENADIPYSPCSTFKIFLALVGYNEGILEDATYPLWDKPSDVNLNSVYDEPKNPTTWIEYSSVWYSMILADKIGYDKLTKYVQDWEYGNQDTSGGKAPFWISSSLKITPSQQMEFLKKLLLNKFPCKLPCVHQVVRNILKVKAKDNPHQQDFYRGWVLYGKTGSGNLHENGSDKRHGWFIGWIEKNQQKILFVQHVTEENTEEWKNNTFSGRIARAQAKEKIKKIIDKID